jgi:hypothetical protein
VPSYNEDEYILATTLAAARSMDYPVDKLKVWLRKLQQRAAGALRCNRCATSSASTT